MALLRYNGGKAKLVRKIIPHILVPDLSNITYLEPFVGGGSMALAFAARYPSAKIVLNDREAEVSNFWGQIVSSPDDQFGELYERVLACKPTIEQFRKLKATEAADGVDMAFRTIFFNRTAFSASNGKRPLGGWGQGECGTIGERWNSDRLAREMLAARRLLAGRTLVFNKDFEGVMGLAKENWTMYLDPPYYKAGNQLYNHPWSDEDHVRLCELLKKATAKWVLSYDFHPRIVDLYNHGMTRSYPMPASYSISKRKEVEALIVPNRDGVAVSPRGYSAPQNFEEFYRRYPSFVRMYVEKKMHWNYFRKKDSYTIFTAMVEDYTQELLLFLSSLPVKSKYRAMGFSDPIQLFNHGLWGGVTQGKFTVYVKMLLSRRFHTIRTGQHKDALPYADERLGSVITARTDSVDETGTDFQTYRRFIEIVRPRLLPVFDSFFDRDLRHKIKNFDADYNKLVSLLRDYFVHGKMPRLVEYKRRKVY